jgi:hypothetical protein
MELSDIGSPTYSVCSNVLKLNSSSIASSTPGCGHQGPFVAFEEFDQSQRSEVAGRPSLPKKNLTIQIDDGYDFEQPLEQGQHEGKLLEVMVQTPDSEVEQYPNLSLLQQYKADLADCRQNLEHSEASRR